MLNSSQIYAYFESLKNTLVQEIKSIDPEVKCVRDKWSRDEGGGGEANCFSGQGIMEKGGVNFSHIKGSKLPPSATKARPELANQSFEAMGVSVVFHPNNPYIPTTHMNVRFFTTTSKSKKSIWWFGGGYDLTPYYPFLEDAISWHKNIKSVCDPFGEDLYPELKANCDEYFYLPHRKETRGVSGLFFDDFNRFDLEKSFAFTKTIGNSFLPNWLEIVTRRKNQSYGQREKKFQAYRRGRYVEFNLLYDRGTLFGLQSGGRTESILMSLPPQVQWEYNWSPAENTKESELYKTFLKPQDWLNFNTASE